MCLNGKRIRYNIFASLGLSAMLFIASYDKINNVLNLVMLLYFSNM